MSINEYTLIIKSKGSQVEWASIVGSTHWLATQSHLSEQEFQQFYNQLEPEVPSELELETEDVLHCTMEEATWTDSGNWSVVPSLADEMQQWDNSPGQQPQQSAEPEEQPHKFQPDSNWVQVSGDNAVAEFDNLDMELGKEKVKDVLGNYFTETEAVVQ